MSSMCERMRAKVWRMLISKELNAGLSVTEAFDDGWQEAAG